MELQGDGGSIAYARLTDYDASVFGGGLSADGKISRRTGLFARVDYHRAYNRNVAQLVDAGLVAGRVLTSTSSAILGLAQQLVSRVSIVADASYQRVSFQDESTPGGDTLSLSGGLSWRPRDFDRVSVSYVHRRTRSSGNLGSSGDVRVSWDRRVARRLDAALSVGWGHAQPLGGAQTAGSTFGSAEARLGGRHGRHGVSASYEHSLQQAYGFGRSLVFDTVSLEESYSLTPRLSAGIRGSLSRGHDPLGIAYRLDAESVSSTLAFRVSPRSTAKAAYSYWTRGGNGGPALSSHVLELSLLYERSSRALVGESSPQ